MISFHFLFIRNCLIELTAPSPHGIAGPSILPLGKSDLFLHPEPGTSSHIFTHFLHADSNPGHLLPKHEPQAGFNAQLQYVVMLSVTVEVLEPEVAVTFEQSPPTVAS